MIGLCRNASGEYFLGEDGYEEHCKERMELQEKKRKEREEKEKELNK